PNLEFERARTSARQKGYKPWTWAQYQQWVLLKSEGLMEGPPDDVARFLQMLTDSFRDAGTPARAVSLNARWAAYQAALAPLRGKKLIDLESGLAGLDEMTLGLRNLTILHAQAGAGKTNLLLQIGLGVLEHEPDAAFVIVSLDMPKDEIIHRLVCNLAQM